MAAPARVPDYDIVWQAAGYASFVEFTNDFFMRGMALFTDRPSLNGGFNNTSVEFSGWLDGVHKSGVVEVETSFAWDELTTSFGTAEISFASLVEGLPNAATYRLEFGTSASGIAVRVLVYYSSYRFVCDTFDVAVYPNKASLTVDEVGLTLGIDGVDRPKIPYPSIPSGETLRPYRLTPKAINVDGRYADLLSVRWWIDTVAEPTKRRGSRSMRQRQLMPATTYSWPLRQRQNGGANGSWPLRQRQASV